MDNKTKEQRNNNMSAVKNKNTKPEILVRKLLFSQGFRFRLNVKNLPGSPDIVLSKYKTVIFVNGCFWHGHLNCKKAKLPETNTDFWARKIEDTKIRDRKKRIQLKKPGWHCIVCWECDILHKDCSFGIYDNCLCLSIHKKETPK
jgi:DNA mismatch endonuclease (patch repair protein)